MIKPLDTLSAGLPVRAMHLLEAEEGAFSIHKKFQPGIDSACLIVFDHKCDIV
jgi:hypothetical protein